MSDDNTVAADTDDLTAFENLLFNREPEKVEKVEDDTPNKGEEAEDDQVEAPEGEDATDPDQDVTDEEDDDDPAPRKKQTAKERIQELTAARKDAERRADDERKSREALEARLQKLEEGSTPKVGKVDNAAKAPEPDAVKEDGQPVYPLGEFDPQYIRDLTKFTIAEERTQAEAEARQKAAVTQAEQAKAELINEWEGKLSKVEAELPDVRVKARGLEEAFTGIDPSYGEYLAATIMAMDKGPEVLYYLSDNISEAKRLAGLGPVKATLALGQIEAELKGTKQKVVKTSSAPTPPPRNRGGSVTTTVAPDTDDLDAFEKAFFKKK